MNHAGLLEEDLYPNGPLSRLGRRVVCLDECESTNALLLERAEELGDGATAVTQYQTLGRGRLGRRWRAPRGSSILMSVLLIEEADSPLHSRATMAASLATVEAVEQSTECRASLSWPNDIFASGKKLGGVLAESRRLRIEGTDRRALVMGIGLNCLQHRGHFDPEIAESATSLELECSHAIDRGAAARSILERLDALIHLTTNAPGGAAALANSWAGRCEDIGSHIDLQVGGRSYTGTVVQIVDNGDLIVQLDDGGRRCFESAKTTRRR